MSQPENDTQARRKAPASRHLPEELTIPPMTYGSWMEIGLAARQMATAAAPADKPAPRRRRARAQVISAA
jgi:hypothetical protein